MTYLLLAIGYLLLAALAWRRLPWAVLLVVATLPSYLIRFRVGSIPMTLLEGMILIIFIAWTIKRFKIKDLRFKKTFNFNLSTYNLPLLLFIVAATISLFVAPDLRAAAGIWKAYFVEPILFFIVLRHLLRNQSTSYELRVTSYQIITALSLTALLLSLYAIYQRFTGFGIPPPWDKELRVTSIFPYPNALALFLGPLVPLMIGNLKLKIKNAKFYILHFTFYIIAITVSVIAIIFAKSTGALVGVGAGLLFMGFLMLRGKTHDRELFHAHARYALRSTFYVFIIAGIIAALLTIPRIKDELLLRNWPGHVRRTQWTETIAMLKDRPIAGAGLAGYKETLAPYHKAAYLEIFEYPHNIVLNFWSETGLLGLLAFTWLVVLFFRAAIPSLKIRGGGGSYEPLSIAAVASMVVMLVHGLVDVPYFKNDLAILFWIVYALGLSSLGWSGRVVEGAALEKR